MEEDLGALSNTLTYDNITTRDLNDDLMVIYHTKKYEKLNLSVGDLNGSGEAKINGSHILGLIDEAPGQYVLPNDITLSNLTEEKI